MSEENSFAAAARAEDTPTAAAQSPRRRLTDGLLNKLLIFTAGAAPALALDQITKHYARYWTTKVPRGMTEPIIPNILEINYAQNVGAAFSMFSGFPLLFFLIVNALAMLFILSFLVRLERGETGMVIALSFVMGGALGNLTDRIRHVHVTDFIYAHYYDKFSWPVFNVADIFICIGVALLVYKLTKAEIVRARRAKMQKAGNVERPLTHQDTTGENDASPY